MKKILSLIFVIVFLFCFVSANIDYSGSMMGGCYGTGGNFFGWIVGLLIVALLLLLIIWLYKQIWGKQGYNEKK